MSSGSVFSETLQNITVTKLEELARKRTIFEQQKSTAIRAANQRHDPLDMLSVLAEGVKLCFSIATRDGKIVRGSHANRRLETDLRNLSRFVDQAHFDPSISPDMIEQWKQNLLKHLDVQSLKYQYADLYGKLTMEWLTSSKPTSKTRSSPGSGSADAMDLGDDFEEVSAKAKVEARQAWERDVFEEASVDPSTINEALTHLLGGQDKEAQGALKDLRNDIANTEHSFDNAGQFNYASLRWTINGLLASDLLTNDKRQVLRDFLSNDVILTELADVLNMRMASIDSWSWGSGVPVEARRQLNGRYHIYMHEDLLQAIFLQYIGVRWSIQVKEALMKFQANGNVWHAGQHKLSPLEKQRRQWFLNHKNSGLSVQQIRSLSYRAGYFVSQLMDAVDQSLYAEEGDEEADFTSFGQKKRHAQVQAPSQMRSKAARRAVTSAAVVPCAARRCEESDQDVGFGLFDDDDYDDSYTVSDLGPYKPKNPMDAKQRLLHLLSTEVLLKTRFQGDFCCVRSAFDSLYSSLPHATILSVLSFFGVSERWLQIFKRFLRAPLKFQDEEEEPRLRRRGTPGSHVLSDVFGEIVLFCLDYTINQETSEILWRMSSDIWFWSASHENCVQVWKIIKTFAQTMGLRIDEDKSAAVRIQRTSKAMGPAKLDKSLPKGEIRWGMIVLDDTTGRFRIDEDMVDKHIEELRRQLKDKESSIFTWVQAYSTYASVFFTSNFGKSANCFGREHLDMMLSMHERIQKTLFSNSSEGVSSVVDWLKKQIARRFGIDDVPDGYLFFPSALGGLDVKSPFIGLLQLRESVTKDPQDLLDAFENAEKTNYLDAKRRYLDRKAWEYPKRDKDYRPQNPEQFMSYEEYTKFREDLNYGFHNQLVQVYETLLKRPSEEPVEQDGNLEIADALNRLGNPYGHPKTITSWANMDPYWKWVTVLYGPEMIQRFSSFEIVDPALLPMGMVGLFKSGRVSWQE